MSPITADTEPGRDNPIVIARVKTAVNQTLAHIVATAGMIPTHVETSRVLNTITDRTLTISSELTSFIFSYTSLGSVDWRIC